MSIEARYALVCDSIRQEDNGKMLFVGVYTGDILVSRYPASIALQVWLDLVAEVGAEPEEFTIRIRQGPDENLILGELGAKLEKVSDDLPIGPTQISLPSIALKVERDSEFIVELREGDAEWQTVVRKPIHLRSDVLETE